MVTLPLSQSIFLEQWSHNRFGGQGDFRKETYHLFFSLGITDTFAWALTNSVRTYACEYVQYFDIDPDPDIDNKIDPDDKVKRYPISILLSALRYKAAHEIANTKSMTIVPHHRSETFRNAFLELPDGPRSVIASYIWGDRPLIEISSTLDPAHFPVTFEPFRDALFRKMECEMQAAIQIEEEALEYWDWEHTRGKTGRRRPPEKIKLQQIEDAVEDWKKTQGKTGSKGTSNKGTSNYIHAVELLRQKMRSQIR